VNGVSLTNYFPVPYVLMGERPVNKPAKDQRLEEDKMGFYRVSGSGLK